MLKIITKIILSICFILILTQISFINIAYARYCNSPSCSMCNRLFGNMTTNNFDFFNKTQQKKQFIVKTTTVPYIESTPQIVVDAMLRELRLTPDDVLYDLGCGDGRILISAVRQYGCKALGIEINPKVAEFARKQVAAAGCGRILIMTGDATKFNLEKATAVTMYLFPPLMEKLIKNIKTDRVVSYSHEIPGRLCKTIVVNKNIDFYKIFLLDEYQYNVSADAPIPADAPISSTKIQKVYIESPFAPSKALLPPANALLSPK